MNLTIEKIDEILSTHKFMLIQGKPENPIIGRYHKVKYVSSFIVQEGQMDFILHGHHFTAGPSFTFTFGQGFEICIEKISEDFKVEGIMFSDQYWKEPLTYEHPYVSLSLIQPTLKIDSNQTRELMEALKVIQFCKKNGYADESMTIGDVINGYFNRLGEYYRKWSENFDSRQDVYQFIHFAKNLMDSIREHRDVSYYANLQEISPAYLSNRLKKLTGHTAAYCIDMYAFTEICNELINTNRSIKEIAAEFHFTDTSHLCKFFKKIAGRSPEEFRNRR